MAENRDVLSDHSACPGCEVCELATQLAIERLDRHKVVTRLRAENEALRGRTCLCAFRGKDHGPVFPSVSDLHAENDRLRGLLTLWLNCAPPDTREIVLGPNGKSLAELTRLAFDDERRAHDELHGCWECGTSDMRGNVCAEHEPGRGPSRETRLADQEER